MARTASPWFWDERNGWYVNKDGQRHFLGDHPPDAAAPRKLKGKWNAPEVIRTAFHTVMSAKPAPQSPQNSRPGSGPGLTLAELFEKFLEWCHKHREKRTYDGYVWHLQRFIDHLKAKDTPAGGGWRPPASGRSTSTTGSTPTPTGVRPTAATPSARSSGPSSGARRKATSTAIRSRA
jgi:hypothetical protein